MISRFLWPRDVRVFEECLKLMYPDDQIVPMVAYIPAVIHEGSSSRENENKDADDRQNDANGTTKNPGRQEKKTVGPELSETAQNSKKKLPDSPDYTTIPPDADPASCMRYDLRLFSPKNMRDHALVLRGQADLFKKRGGTKWHCRFCLRHWGTKDDGAPLDCADGEVVEWRSPSMAVMRHVHNNAIPWSALLYFKPSMRDIEAAEKNSSRKILRGVCLMRCDHRNPETRFFHVHATPVGENYGPVTDTIEEAFCLEITRQVEGIWHKEDLGKYFEARESEII